MKLKRTFQILTLLLIGCASLSLTAQNRLVIEADRGLNTINRHIYGNFSEHLGRCIYGGYWVGEESSTPNKRGIRNDVVEALKEIRIPNLRWPRGCFFDFKGASLKNGNLSVVLPSKSVVMLELQ